MTLRSALNGYRLNGYAPARCPRTSPVFGVTTTSAMAIEDKALARTRTSVIAGARGDLLFEPNENLSFRPLADYDQDR